MVPPTEAAALKVVQTELSFEVLVDAFGAPALLDDADQLLSRSVRRQCQQEIAGGLRLAFRPLDEQPQHFSLLWSRAIGMASHHPASSEIRVHRSFRPVAPHRRIKPMPPQRARNLSYAPLGLSQLVALALSAYEGETANTGSLESRAIE